MCDAPHGPLGRPIELLLVEDNHGDILLTQEAFKMGKIANNITVAQDGQEALNVLQKEAPYGACPMPDLILLDLNLPRKDGREVLQEIKSDPRFAKIPVVVLTGSQAEIDVIKSYEHKANCYIVKPVNFERLREIVASIETFWFAVVVLPGQGHEERADGTGHSGA